MAMKHGNRCGGKTKEGKLCRAAAMPNGLCFFHGNPIKASELGRKGGQSKRRLDIDATHSLPSLDTVKSVHEVSKRLFEETYSGKRSPKDAPGLVRLLELITAGIRFTDLEQRIAKLERQGTRSEEGPSSPDNPPVTGGQNSD